MMFKQAIRISKGMRSIFNLPCVAAIRKGIFGEAFFDLYGFIMHNGKNAVAKEGDWLCENYNERWHLLTNEEYEQLKDNNNGD